MNDETVKQTDNNSFDASKEFLLKEYDYFTESFRKNEEIGETRVNFFTAFVTAAIGGLVALINADKCITGLPLMYIIIASLFSLLAIGLLTLQRLLKRNKVTDEYKHALDVIRDLFRKQCSILASYDPLLDADKLNIKANDTDSNEKMKGKCRGTGFIAEWLARRSLNSRYSKDSTAKNIDEFMNKEIRKTRTMGGLTDLVAVINALLCAGLAAAIVYYVPDCINNAKSRIDNWNVVVISALVTFAIALALQRIYIIYSHYISKYEIKQHLYT